MRKGARPSDEIVLVVCNFTPVPRHDYRVGVSARGLWREMLNSDAREYGGSGLGNLGGVEHGAQPLPRPAAVAESRPAAAGRGGLEARGGVGNS